MALPADQEKRDPAFAHVPASDLPEFRQDGATVRVIIGEGDVGGDNVMIDNPLIDRRWTAAKTDPISEDWDLNAR